MCIRDRYYTDSQNKARIAQLEKLKPKGATPEPSPFVDRLREAVRSQSIEHLTPPEEEPTKSRPGSPLPAGYRASRSRTASPGGYDAEESDVEEEAPPEFIAPTPRFVKHPEFLRREADKPEKDVDTQAVPPKRKSATFPPGHFKETTDDEGAVTDSDAEYVQEKETSKEKSPPSSYFHSTGDGPMYDDEEDKDILPSRDAPTREASPEASPEPEHEIRFIEAPKEAVGHELCLQPEPHSQPPPVEIQQPREEKRGTTVMGAFFVIAFLLTWATLD